MLRIALLISRRDTSIICDDELNNDLTYGDDNGVSS